MRKLNDAHRFGIDHTSRLARQRQLIDKREVVVVGVTSFLYSSVLDCGPSKFAI